MSFVLPSKLPQYLSRLAAHFEKANGSMEEVIRSCRFYVREEVAYDNLDGGTYGHGVVLFLPSDQLFAIDISQQADMQGELLEPLRSLSSSISNEFFLYVVFELIDENDQECQEAIPFSATPPINPDTVSFWKQGLARVFISHRDAHKVEARKLGDALEDYGFSCFVAHDTIKPRTEWREEIMKGLRTMEVMLAFVTDDFAGSLWCQQEVGFALGKDVPVLSFKVGDADPPGFISHVQAKKGKTDNPEQAATELAPLIGEALGADGRLQEVLINSFTDSLSYVEAQERFERMDTIVTRLKSDQANKIAARYRENGQLFNCFFLARSHRLVRFMDRATNGNWVIVGRELIDRNAPPS